MRKVHGRLPSRPSRWAFEPPRRAQAPGHGARPERPERLTEARTRRILRGGDADVVAAVVLDIEVAVCTLGEGDPRHPPFQVHLLVAEFVRGVDTDAGDATDRDRQADLVPATQRAVDAQPTQVVRGEEIARQDQRQVLHRHERVGEIAVVPVVLQLLHHLLGRVLPVRAEEPVGDRDQHVDQDRPDPPQHVRERVETDRVEARHQRYRDEQRRRREQAPQPPVPLAIAPPGRARRGCSGFCGCGHLDSLAQLPVTL